MAKKATQVIADSKTAILQRNIGNDFLKFTNNEPMNQPRTYDSMCRERDLRLGDFEHENSALEDKSLNEVQKKYIYEKYDCKIELMEKGDRCFDVMSFEEINIGDMIQTGAFKNGSKTEVDAAGMQVEVDVMQKFFAGYDGIVKQVREVTKNEKAKNDIARYFFVVV